MNDKYYVPGDLIKICENCFKNLWTAPAWASTSIHIKMLKNECLFIISHYCLSQYSGAIQSYFVLTTQGDVGYVDMDVNNENYEKINA
jgi:hypothetical protein